MNETELQKWANANEPSEAMYFYQGYWDQIIFVRDMIPQALSNTYKQYEKLSDSIGVISTHSSKSITLPVYRFTWNKIKFTIRNNFHDWKISIDSPSEIDIDFMDIFDTKTKKSISSCYCEGFPSGDVHPAYAMNKKKFTISIGDKYNVYTFFWLLKNSLGENK